MNIEELALKAAIGYVEGNTPHLVRDEIRTLVSERDELASRVRELEGERDKLQTAAMLVLAWYEAEENHGDTTFMQRIEMCRESEDALRAALNASKGTPL